MNVQDPRFAVGRGDEWRAGVVNQRMHQELELQSLDGDFRLPLNRYLEENVDLDETECASLDAAIPDTNVGYRLLQKLGWRGGGLGREQQGIREPVRLDANDTGTRIGLGRAAVERQYTAAELVERRALESELQAEEDDDRRRKREAEAERQQKIKEEVTHELRMFYCEICRKQYQFAHEMEEHLCSYDHHHRKRLAEMRAMASERTRGSRMKKEKRRAEKEAARIAAQVRAAQVAAGIVVEEEEQPPLPPLPADCDGEGAPPPPPLPADAGNAPLLPPPPAGEAGDTPQQQQQQQQQPASEGERDGLGGGPAKKPALGVFSLGRGRGKAAPLPQRRPAGSVFGEESSDEGEG
ncbi:G patch domain-containing 8 [Micractinium conductrix]|uniref:G patch domain-containing 8 n=1 Tax=Micractinium conductrix TaxID=554055 RepID=A0A2P6VNN8_9CHLO|nr:G patch domain-containing 8 [Micractinium conductrix]|eukprot:PSC75708.1 G patch domain-containing 8 [Micractinium conductrix]